MTDPLKLQTKITYYELIQITVKTMYGRKKIIGFQPEIHEGVSKGGPVFFLHPASDQHGIPPWSDPLVKEASLLGCETG